jgi:flagellar basal body-associated protein FliL
MSRKLKIILAVVAGVVMLALGGGAVVMAAGSTTTPTTSTATQSNPLFAKAAAILGVTERQLTAAYQQANTQAHTTSSPSDSDFRYTNSHPQIPDKSR